ncbi:hypothetical protein AMTR_s00010p00233080 [Amborella trichopoda]|uniref:Myb/SANT-like domain-containing protein n=1 Tax=Amborella trichopoda TaxID=13333 RepID=W1NFP2_AMBTC|nr:hypothetical protein AMTR_s00010p00233080 [Amborella trichopoda]
MDPHTSSSTANDNIDGKRNLQWTQSEEDCFIYLMEKETKTARNGGGFKKGAWGRMVEAMRAKYGPINTETRLKSKHKFFRTMYRDIKKLMAVSGFRWDGTRRIVIAEVAVWNDFIAENEWANKYHNKTLPDYSLLCKIYEGGTTDGTPKLIGGGIRNEPERPNTAFSDDPPLEVQYESSSSSRDGLVSSGSKRRRSHTPIRKYRQSKQPSLAESMTKAMTEMAQSIKMLACDIAGRSSTRPVIAPVGDGPSKARRDAFKIVEGMWKAGEVSDEVLLTATTIFQDSTKAEMLLNLEDRRIQRAYLDREMKRLQ